MKIGTNATGPGRKPKRTLDQKIEDMKLRKIQKKLSRKEVSRKARKRAAENRKLKDPFTYHNAAKAVGKELAQHDPMLFKTDPGLVKRTIVMQELKRNPPPEDCVDDWCESMAIRHGMGVEEVRGIFSSVMSTRASSLRMVTTPSHVRGWVAATGIGATIPKVMKALLDGLEANIVRVGAGGEIIVVPDHKIRADCADKLSKIWGLQAPVTAKLEVESKVNLDALSDEQILERSAQIHAQVKSLTRMQELPAAEEEKGTLDPENPSGDLAGHD